MTVYTTQRLYELLPAIYRLRDAQQDDPLRSLLAVIAREIGIVEEDLARLYANSFVETADEWAVPYIGDLLGVRGLHAIESTGITRRALVANTLSYRRRKGTPSMLEQLARDTTLWNARVVEFFERLGTTQYLNHPRPHNRRTPDLRQAGVLELLDGPFDTIAHTAEVRRIATGRGRHNIPNIGIFLWRLQAYSVTPGTPRPVAADGRYTFSPLGNDAPLFNRPQTETTISHLAGEPNVPGRLRRRALYDDLEQYRQGLTTGHGGPTSAYFDRRQPVLEVALDQVPLAPEELTICDLRGWDAVGWLPPASRTDIRLLDGSSFTTRVAVDPVLGRLTVLDNAAKPQVAVRYTYGFSGDLGGGPYDRRRVPTPAAPVAPAYEDRVAVPTGLGRLYQVPTAGLATVADAITRWTDEGRPAAVIQIEDGRTYPDDLSIPMGDADLALQAANGQRPTLSGRLRIEGDGTGRLALDGLLIAGTIKVTALHLRQLDVAHCTLVPGVTLAADGSPVDPLAASIAVDPDNRALTLNLSRSITGPLRLGADLAGLHARDCIIDSPRRDHPAELMPVLVSAALPAVPAGLPALPRLRVTIGGDGPHLATFAQLPTTLAQARDALEGAIRTARPQARAFALARVIVIDDRLIVLPGVAAEVAIEAPADDDSAVRLGLTQGTGEQRLAVVSGALAPFPSLSATVPALALAIGDQHRALTLTPRPTTLATARDRLQTAIRAADPAPAFARALVGSLSDPDRLVVIPGAPDLVPAFDLTPTEPTTLTELRLAHGLYLPAIGGDRAGARPGPATTLEQVTVLGTVHVQELTLASATIFTAPVRTLRRQTGCVRFSFVPPGARTPRRFRCQPDLALAAALAAAQGPDGAPLDPALAAAIGDQVRGRLVPAFTATRYGDPAYGQLRLTCPVELRTGAEDGAEMGAFSFLKQPQRLADLQSSLDEYLRFGLEAGIFFAT